MRTYAVLPVSVFTVVISLSLTSFAEETTMEKAETSTNKAADSVKRSYRDAQDKSCEMINGKLQCFGKKMKNKVKNLSDEVKTKETESKNKKD